MNVDSFRTSGFTVVPTAVVALTQHDGEITHSRLPFLRHRISFRRKGESVLTFDVSQTLCQIGHRVVQGDKPDGQLGLLGLCLLVLCRVLLGTPFFLLHHVHIIQRRHLTHPGLNHGIYRTLPAGKLSSDIGNQIQVLLLTMNVEHHTRCQHPDTRTDSCHHRHRQLRSHSVDRLLHALRHLESTKGRLDDRIIIRIVFARWELSLLCDVAFEGIQGVAQPHRE